MNTKIILLVFIVIFTSCESKRTTNDFFFDYLETTHNIYLDEVPALYVIVPHIGCKGCMERALPELVEKFDSLDSLKLEFNVIYIIANDRFQYQAYLDGKKILYDLEDKISTLAIRISGITLIHVNDNMELSFYHIQDEVIDQSSFISFLEKCKAISFN